MSEGEPVSNTPIEPTVIRTLEISQSTDNALRLLAEIQGYSGDDWYERLSISAFRTVEWIIYGQLSNEILIRLKPPELDLLIKTKSKKVSGERESLVLYLEPDQIDKAREYFESPHDLSHISEVKDNSEAEKRKADIATDIATAVEQARAAYPELFEENPRRNLSSNIKIDATDPE